MDIRPLPAEDNTAVPEPAPIELYIPGLLTAGRALFLWVILEAVRFGYGVGWDMYLGVK